MFPDVRSLDPLARYQAAEAYRQAHDVLDWPAVPGWNSAPCSAHKAVDPLCRRCGVILRRHQRVGAMWLWFAGRGLLADVVGLGKTAQIAMVMAMCRATGELGLHSRVVIICKPAAIRQWRDELHRMMPGIHVITADGTPKERHAAYMRNWEVCIISPQTLSPARGKTKSRAGDIEALELFPRGMVVYDDTDGMRNHSNRQSYAICRLAEGVPRVYGMHGTSLQKHLVELYNFLIPLGAMTVFGTEAQFKRRHVTQEKKYWYVQDPDDPTGRNKILRSRLQDSGLKNQDELRAMLAPLVLRRRAADVDDMSIPAIVPSIVWLDPAPEQSRAYEELRQGVLRKLNEEGDTIDVIQAKALWMHGWQICSGLATMGRDTSVKLDWVESFVTRDLDEDEKAVVFVNFKPNVAALQSRLSRAGVGSVVLWGDERSPNVREQRRLQFWEDPSCRVLIGTTTIEASLNLQCARHVVAVDTIANPARMTQIVGRVARSGSAYATVYFHQLLMRGTQEDFLPAQLSAEQGIADAVWEETGDLFSVATPQDILRMIAGRAQLRPAA